MPGTALRRNVQLIEESESKFFHGVAASPGIGVGKVYLLEKEELAIIKRTLKKEDLAKEVARFRKALHLTRKELESDKAEMLKALGKTHARLADAYLLILEDPILTKDIEKQISKERVNCEYLIQAAMEKLSRTFDTLTDDYFRERINDIVEVSHKILRHLLGFGKKIQRDLDEESIIVAHNLLPSDTINLKTHMVKGFAIDVGGKTSHTALLAQSLEIPAVVGLKEITAHVQTGDLVIIDGNQGMVILNPDPEAIKNYKREKEIQIRETQELIKLRDLPAQTLDGKRIELSSNIETADDIKNVLYYGSEGIGLFRTEYLFMNRSQLPSEEEQLEHYSRVAKKMMPYHTLFRTLDIGGDKLKPFIEGYSEENNPFLGLRALRFCLKYPDIFRTQLRALFRASAEGNIRIMFPMVSSVEEFLQGKAMAQEIREDLIRQRVPIAPKIEIGAMIEVPSAAVTSDIIAREADFLSIGTNDLIQYTLAVDRINENVASMYDPLHLSILRLIKTIADSAHSHGKWVGMCGEMASDTHFTQLLLGLDMDEFSVVPAFVPKLKQIIRSTTLPEARRLSEEIMAMKDSARAMERLKAS